MHSLSKLLAISLISLASSSSIPIFANEVIVTSIDYEYQYFDQEIYSNSINNNPKSAVTNSPKHTVEVRNELDNKWMITVNGQPTFRVEDLPQAAIAVAKLATIMNSPDFDPNQLQPTVINDQYIGKYKELSLFAISKSDVLNPSLNLTQWINNLRVAAGAEPLTLVEAQKQMHKLAATDEQIDGLASWYGPYFQGRQTASGENFEQQDFTAAHPSLPFDTYLKVTNQHNGKSVVVRINDRGPYFGDRNLDLSHAAAIALNSDEAGVVPIIATILVESQNN